MRPFQLTILILLLTTASSAQQLGFDLKNITFNGVEFSTTKANILNAFGPAKKVETDYDCGFFSNDQEGGPYYQLEYEHFNYIGSDKQRFYLENLDFDPKGETILKYGHKALHGKTTKDDFIQIFGDKAKEHFEKYPQEDSILLFSTGSDDAGLFTFRNGKLIKFEYWTPC